MFLSHLISPKFAQLDREKLLAVCALGALEQHSNHMPLGTDHLIGEALVNRVEAAMPDRVVCLPTVWFGCSGHHLGFDGTVSVSTKTMSHIITDLAESLQRSGIKRLLLLNSHGGNSAVMATTIQELGSRNIGMTVAGISYWDAARDELMAARQTALGGMGHACELETSLMLCDRADLVDMQAAEPDGIQAPSRFTRGEMLAAPAVIIYKSVSSTSKHGGFGDPTSASAHKGELFYRLVVRGLLDLCEDMLRDRL